jgi:hypothetical protein
MKPYIYVATPRVSSLIVHQSATKDIEKATLLGMADPKHFSSTILMLLSAIDRNLELVFKYQLVIPKLW